MLLADFLLSPQMVSKISLLKISADASLLECKCAAQDFIVATDAVFTRAQGLVMLAPLHRTVVGLLEELLDDWCLLNLDSVEWRHKAEVCQACVNLWSLNKQVPWWTAFRKTLMVIELELTAPVVVPKTVVDPAPTPASATSSIQHAPSIPYIADPSSPPMHGKGKAKVMEEDKDKEGEAAQKLRKELEDFMVPTKSKGCLWNGVGIRMQKKHPPLEALIIAKHIKLVQAAKAFFEKQGKSSQFFVLEGFKGKGKTKALLGDSEPMGTKQSFKSTELVEIGTRKGKEIIELEDLEKETVAPKTPAAGPSHQTLKPMVLVSGAPKPVPKPIIVSVPKPTATASVSKPAPVESAGTEESGALIINQVTEVAAGKVTSVATQETLQDKATSDEDDNDGDSNDNEGVKGDDDDSDNKNNATMDIDSSSLDAKVLKVLHP
ncbi:hypothetical protein C0995_002493 [Termitomyces sp. Mi166|nr:hypothetical protein C0995_002493 [Termitomyces sp. Mi166\